MLDNKKLSLVLFGSLAANIFLGGLIVGKLAHDKGHPHHENDPTRVLGPKHHHEGTATRPHAKDGEARDPGKEGHRSTKGPRDRGPRKRGGPAEGSSDLRMLRHMVRIMGGPSDPRIRKVRDQKRDEIRAIRGEMRKAHEAVRAALSSDEFNEAALVEALKKLREQGATAQAHAQEGIVTLAALMTPEERKKLSEEPPLPPRERLR